MVGWLVQKQDIGLLEQKAAQSHSAPLSTGQISHFCIRRRALERIHSPFELRINFPASEVLDFLGQFSLSFYQGCHFFVGHRLAELEVHLFVFLECVHHFLHTLLHHFQHSLVCIHLRLLLQIAHGVAGSPDHLALILFFHSCYNLHQGGFS